MKLTLKSLQTEMRNSFADVSLRVDNVENNLTERTDRILLRLDAHIKDTDFRFREVDQRFNEVDRRFDQVDQRFDQVDQRFDRIDQRFGEVDRRFDRQTNDIVTALSPYFKSIEKMLTNHEERITTLEKRH